MGAGPQYGASEKEDSSISEGSSTGLAHNARLNTEEGDVYTYNFRNGNYGVYTDINPSFRNLSINSHPGLDQNDHKNILLL